MPTPLQEPDAVLLKRIRTVSSLGILLDGYNLSVIAVALVPLTRQFHLTPAATGLLASSMLLGSIVGGLGAGILADRFGRKTLLMGDLIIFMIFSLLSSVVLNYHWLILFRFVVGLAVGADYAISPTYLAEFAPDKTRGYHLGYVWLAWSVGAVLNFALGAVLVTTLPPQLSWRILFAIAIVPAGFGLFLRQQLPESPRWLQYGSTANTAHPTSLMATSQSKSLGQAWRLSLIPWFLMDFSTYGLGLLLPVLLKSTGLTSTAGAILGTGLAALCGGFGSLWAMRHLDSTGRIVLQVRGFLLSGLGLWLLAALLWMDFTLFIVLLGGLMMVNLFNSTGPGTTTGIIPAEIFPTPMRATALGVATAVSRIGAVAGVFVLGFIDSRYGLGAVLAVAGSVALSGSLLSWIWRIEPNQNALPDMKEQTVRLIDHSLLPND